CVLAVQRPRRSIKLLLSSSAFDKAEKAPISDIRGGCSIRPAIRKVCGLFGIRDETITKESLLRIPHRDLHRNESSSSPLMPMLPNDNVASLYTAARKRSLLPGYLGPMSFISPLTDAGDLAPGGKGLESGPCGGYLAVLLGNFTIIEGLIREYYALSQGAVIPAPVILNSLGPLRRMLQDCSDKKLEESINPLTIRVIHNTAETFEIPSSITGKEFHKLYTGPAIRLEIIGVICSIAGQAGSVGLARTGLGKDVSPPQFARAMLAASDIVIHICKILTPANDLTIWLTYQNLLLTDLVHGDSSPTSWSRLGELSTDLFALGYHRDGKDSGNNAAEVPEFLVEIRRRQFSAAYQFDKSLATFLGRPPRISKRYINSLIPKDLSDEALATGHRDLSHLQKDLDADGWNIHRPFQRATWIRVRYIISTFREEILEVSMQNITPETKKVLNDISFRSHQAWENLPAHIHGREKSLHQGEFVANWLMTVVSYLAYLYNDFLVQRLLAGKSNPQGSAALLSVSADILSTVLSIGTYREQCVDLRPDFTWILLLYGFPSASLLMKALQHHKRTGEQFLYEGSRAQLIRHLSVFISYLETIASPDNANYPLFQRTGELFSKMLDEVLEPEAYLQSSNASDDSLMDIDRMIAMDGLELFNTIDISLASNQWMF
ncbi:hypothetical protein N7468_004809, partial [Penicillium chermesinum]